MKITVVHSRKTGSTRAVAALLADEIKKLMPESEINEFCVSDAKPCVGCANCKAKDEKLCPHYEEYGKIIESIETSDVIVLGSPVYVLSISGQMKCFLDHMAYRFMSHRPHPAMFSKIGISVTTAAGIGAKSVAKALNKQLFWWGTAKQHSLAFTVAANDWSGVSEDKKHKINLETKRTARKIVKTHGKVKPGLKTKFIFNIMKSMQKKNDWLPIEKAYWQQQGWIK